jgi:hypothetical protein
VLVAIDGGIYLLYTATNEPETPQMANYNVNTVMPQVFVRKAAFYRERASNMYSGHAYAIAEQLIEDPYIFIEVCCVLP